VSKFVRADIDGGHTSIALREHGLLGSWDYPVARYDAAGRIVWSIDGNRSLAEAKQVAA